MNHPKRPVPDSTEPPAEPASGDLERTRTEVAGEPRSAGPDTPSHGSSAGAAPGAGAVERSFPIDESGRYVFVNEHARGGLGRLLQAEDQRLGRTVAVKELARSTELARSLFMREALITARLQHPGIVPVHDAGRHPTGAPYYVMKMLSGRSLKRAIRARATLEERLALLPNVIVVAETIAYAHSQGVIHRDIKPANIMVGEFGETVVVDWGLAADRHREAPATEPRDTGPGASFDPPCDAALAATLAMEGDSGRSTGSHEHSGNYSISGKVMGTPAYMSPEQARGERVAESTDIYALGALLYHVLAGEPPYPPPGGDSDPRALVDQVRAGPPVPLEQRAPGVPPDLVTIVRTAMARDPAERYASAKQLAEELKRFQTGQLVAAHEYSTWTLLQRWLWRHRSPVAVAVVGLVILAVMTIWAVDRIVNERNEARAQRAEAQSARHKAEARRNDLLLLQAESSLSRDPTAALAWLKRVPLAGPRLPKARALADEAVALGVAEHVLVHNGPAQDVTLLPGGETVATAGYDPQIRLWNVDSGAMDILGDAPPSPVLRLVSSADGRYLYSLAMQGEVHQWDVRAQTSRALFTVPGGVTYHDVHLGIDGRRLVAHGHRASVAWDVKTGRIRTVQRRDPAWRGQLSAVSHDTGLVTAIDAGELVVMDPDTRAEVRRIALEGRVTESVFSLDDSYLVMRTGSGHLHALHLDSGKVRQLGEHPVQLASAVVSPDRRFLATISYADKNVYLWDLEAGRHRVLRGHEDSIFQVLFSADSATLLSASDDGSARVWNLVTGQTRPLLGHRDDVMRVAVAAGGTRVLTVSLDGTVRVWRRPEERVLKAGSAYMGKLGRTPSGALLAYSPGAPLRTWKDGQSAMQTFGQLPPLDSRAYAVKQSRDSAYIAAEDGSDIVLVHLPSRQTHRLSGHEGDVVSLALSAPHLVSVDEHGTVLRWDLETRERAPLVDIERATLVAYAPDGEHLAVGAGDEVQLWNLAERRIAARVSLAPATTAEALWMRFSPDASWLAVQTRSGELLLWNLAADRSRWLDPGFGNIWAISAAFSPDSAELAIAFESRVIGVWPTVGGPARLLSGHDDLIYDIAYSPGGATLASASHDHTIRLWNTRTGEAQVLRGHTAPVVALLFWRESLASLSWDGTIRLWSLDDPVQSPAALRRLLDAHTTAIIDDSDHLGTPRSP